MKRAKLFCLMLIILLAGWQSVMGCGRPEVSDCAGSVCAPVLKVLKFSRDLPLSPQDPFWTSENSPPAVSIELGPQLITNPQWPNPSIKKVRARAARTQSEIAIWLEWQDDSQETRFSNSGLYSDQAALMFPLDPRQEEPPPITMGAEGMAVNIWQWKAVLQKAGGGSPVEDLNAEGFSTLTFQAHQDVAGKGVWSNKVWQVVFKRSLRTSDAYDAQFENIQPMAIAVWNGANRETNGQKGISYWFLLKWA
ncbi:MAG: ethylbenzene dehydrogenase-related protein [Nitrospinales bacterium]